MGLVTPKLVQLLKQRQLVVEEALCDTQCPLGKWLECWQTDSRQAAEFLEHFFGMPYRMLQRSESFLAFENKHVSFTFYQQIGTQDYFCTMLPTEEVWEQFRLMYPNGVLYLTDESVLRSVMLKKFLPITQATHRIPISYHILEEWQRQGEGHIDGFLAEVLADAIKRSATDIHLYVQENSLYIIFRCHGVLEQYAVLPNSLADLSMNKLKLLAEMDIAEHRLPQDGHFQVQYQGLRYHLRLGTLPLREGEKIVIRILPEMQQISSLEALGFQTEQMQQLTNVLEKQQGLLLITGPTNSGKTTTLYALLHTLSTKNQMIYTIEDPIEAILPNIEQMQVNNKSGFHFATGLRGILRSDPDIIAIGELRDSETVEIAAKAALSGHLVVATLHAYDAQQAIGRLRDLGLSDLLIGAVVAAIVNQRLVTKPCPNCHGTGILSAGCCCTQCLGNGSAGRQGIQEVWVLNNEERRAIEEGSSTIQLRQMAISKGFMALPFTQ